MGGGDSKKYKSLVTSILFYGCETRTVLADSQKWMQVFETRCLRKFLCLSYSEHKTKNWVQSEINFFVDSQERLPATVNIQKLGSLS